MRIGLLLIILLGNTTAQEEGQTELPILDDPDPVAYLDHLLEEIFPVFDLYTADSVDLEAHGYSRHARKVIIAWQHERLSGASPVELRDSLRGEDYRILHEDLHLVNKKVKRQWRHRFQYSPSLQGWRILNKARVWSHQGSLNLVSEQDPGEERLTDHVAIALVRQRFSWTDILILGDYHINWGGGLLLRQSQARMTMNPKEFKQTKRLVLRPHYSTRESGFFRGLATGFSQGPFHGAFFVSRRTWRGLEKGGIVMEDADGIHPPGKQFILRHQQTMGVGTEIKFPLFTVYAATLYQPGESRHPATEYGISATIDPGHHFQLYTTGFAGLDLRWNLSWTYTAESLIVALQYRHYDTTEDLVNGSTLTLLGNAASNESGLSLRVEIKKASNQSLRYVLMVAESATPHTYLEYPRVQFHKLQYIHRFDETKLQVDLQQRQEDPAFLGDIWNSQLQMKQVKKGSISATHQLSPSLIYRLNLKCAFEQSQRGMLVQQRLSGTLNAWKWSIGYVRFHIPQHNLRLSIYETSVAESFGFFTAFNDGERFFLYGGLSLLDQLRIEIKLSDTRILGNPNTLKQLAMQFQLSVVL